MNFIRQNRIAALTLSFAGMLPLAQSPAQEDDADDDGAITFAFSLENDLFASTDQNYTNGTKLSWDYADAASVYEIDRLPAWAKLLASKAPRTRENALSYGATISLGQSIFTPKDIETEELVVDDRPYAGWTYMSLALRERTGSNADTFELTLGVVGPHSYAEDVQNWVHEKIGSAEAKGWGNQLKDEVGVVLAWRRDSELFSFPDSTSGWGADINTSYGAVLGNVYTHAHGGVDLRFGYNRKTQAAPPRIRPGNTAAFPTSQADPRLRGDNRSKGFFLTVGSEVRYVARNIFVEGNTWADSHGLPANDWVGDYYAGLTFLSRNWTVSYVYTRRSEEFEGQVGPHEFGGVTIAYTF